MTGLPSSIIKKYGVTKKAWSVFRGMRSSSRTSPMARKKGRKSKGGRKSKSRGDGFSHKRLFGTIAGAMIYGAGREWTSNKLAPITAKIPFGDLSDEALMGVLSYFIAKGKIPLINRIPLSKDIGLAGLTIESARVGAYLGAKFIPGQTSSTSSSMGSGTYNY